MKDLDQRVRRSQAFLAFEGGDFLRAYALGNGLLRRNAHDRTLREMIGVAAANIGRTDDAQRHLRKALRLDPRKPMLHLALAETYVQQGRLDHAIAQYDRLLSLAPTETAAVSGKAMLLQRRGDYDAARALVRPYVQEGREDGAMAAVYATIDQSEGRFGETIDLILRHLSSPRTDLAARKTLCTLAARAYGKTGDYDKAFAAFTLSNEIIEQPFDADAFREAIETLIAVFSRQNLAILPRAGDRSALPVFIACLPRSGSTLVEQIIHAHPQAYGAGEITDLEELILTLPQRLESIQPYPACLGDLTATHADAASRWYLERLRAHDRGAKRIANKHLENWRHLGMVALLFPGAHVIHCRRDPMDNCFSIYMAAMNPATYPWAASLSALGLVYRQHERLMAHWRDVLDLEILDVEYEALVADPEPGIRRIIEFCGLPWDEGCLRFHEAERDVMTLSYDQVRRPIYTSAVKRYEKYAAHLGPLREALAAR